jgi:hypothetical protein
MGECPPDEKFLSVPYHLTASIGKKENFFEIGIGGSELLSGSRKRHFLFPLIGYRLQPVKPSKINIRAYLCYPFSGNPYSGDSDNLFFIPAGFSIGWCF